MLTMHVVDQLNVELLYNCGSTRKKKVLKAHQRSVPECSSTVDGHIEP